MCAVATFVNANRLTDRDHAADTCPIVASVGVRAINSTTTKNALGIGIQHSPVGLGLVVPKHKDRTVATRRNRDVAAADGRSVNMSF